MKKLRTLLFLSTFILLFSCSIFDLTTNTHTEVNNNQENPILEIHFIDVGQADSIYFKLPNGDHMLIDAGNNTDGPLVVDYLNNHGVTKLDYLIGTHPHEDHIGGLDDVITTFEIGNIYMPEYDSTTKTYEDVLNAIAAKNMDITSAKAGVILFDTLLNDITLKAVMLSPINENYSNTNNYSAVVKLIYGNTTYLFTGDAEDSAEEIIIDSDVDLKADVLKLGHHGSSTSTSQAFLDLVDPDIAIISVGNDNNYGHPHIETIAKLTNKAIDLYRTDKLGTIVLESDGLNINIDKNSVDEPVVDINENVDKIFINEFLPQPSSDNEEWVELYNGTDEPIDISGYQIDDVEGGRSPKTIESGSVIEAKGYFVLYLEDVFNNDGDDVRLFNKFGTVIDTFTYNSAEVGNSWYRGLDGEDWSQEMCQNPTLGLTNTK